VKEEKPETWDGFLMWAKSLVADPANRMADASLRLKNLVQRDTQSVREIATMVEELEEDLLSLTPSEERAWRMLNALRPEIRREVLRENKTITSREQVIVAAQRQEELLKQGRVARRPQGELTESTRDASEKLEASSRRDASEGRLRPEQRVCYQCRQTGHIAKDCPKTDKTSTSQK
jgi:hypothetical protein